MFAKMGWFFLLKNKKSLGNVHPAYVAHPYKNLSLSGHVGFCDGQKQQDAKIKYHFNNKKNI
jgi:hypothetical protein